MAVACAPCRSLTARWHVWVQLAYAVVTLMVYGNHFAPGPTGWAQHSSNLLNHPAARAACGAAPPPAVDAAVGPPDDRLAGEPLAAESSLLPETQGVVGAQPAPEGPGVGARPGLDSHDSSDGWELVGERGADVTERTGAQPPSGATAAPAQHGQQATKQAAMVSANDTAPSEAAGAATGVGGLRQRGGPASTSAPAAGGSDVPPFSLAGQGRSTPAEQQQDSSHVLRMCGHFTLQAWLSLGSF